VLIAPRESSRTARTARQRRREPSTIGLVIGGRIERADIPLLCARVGELLDAGDVELVLCDVGAVSSPDAVTVDVLARLALTSRRRGLEFRLRNASGELQALLSFVGLRAAVPLVAGPLRFEPGGQTEEREEGVGVEEVRDPRDPTA